ncbi:MAG: HD domain-containing protein [Calditrichia bacterium]
MKLTIERGRSILQKIWQIAAELNMTVYAVGGFVRDLYLGKEGVDIDFVVLGDALTFARVFSRRFHSGKVVTFPRFGTAMLQYRDFRLEFVSARQEHYEADSRKPEVKRADLHSDLSRRDFTINTLAMDIGPENFGEVTDIYNGIADIDRRLIRTPLEPVTTFRDDPLRILRALRFASVLNFKIEEKTLQGVKRTRERLQIISQERISEEFKKMMMTPRPSVALELLKETGILPFVLPELEDLAGVEQRKDFHHKDVYLHTLKVLDNIAGKTEKFELRLAALLHDIAKPQTKRFDQEVGWTFHGHEELGAHMSERILRRMRFPLNVMKYVRKLVRLHLRPMQLVDEAVTDSAVRRLMLEAGEDLEDLMKLCRADITSHNPRRVRQYLNNFDLVEEKMKEVEEKDKIRNFKPAIDGNEIMEILNIPPGPAVGKIKQAVTDAILDGKIPNEHEACLQYMISVKDQL